MKYIVAYVPYLRGDHEQIELVFCDTEAELVRTIVEDIGCAPVEYDDGVYYDEDGYEVEFNLASCLSYLEEEFVGDGSFGAVMVTVTQGTQVLFQR